MTEEIETEVRERSVRRDTHSRGRECTENQKAARSKLGRPKRYPKLMRIRLTFDEHQQLSQRANDAGMSLSRHIIESALVSNGASTRNSSLAEASLLQREWAIYEVSRIGNNLNQIARQLNSQTGSISSERIEETLYSVGSAVSKLRRLLDQGHQ